jgi:thioredoxin-related protein
MTKWMTVLAAVAISTAACASDGWMTDFEKAKAKAKADEKYILINFSGSDWCGWCIKLDKEVFSQRAFKDYARDNLVLMLADFPSNRSKQSEEVQKQNEQLKNDFSISGFPTVFILSPDGKTVAKTGYQPDADSAEEYVEHIKTLIAQSK